MNLEILKHEEFGAIRVQQVAGQPWFVAKDVCQALGLINTSMAVKSLQEDERAKYYLGPVPQGGQVSGWHVNESGLYQLIFQSRKPQAKVFTRWVTGEVLPAIRKEGRYEVGGQAGPGQVVPTLNGVAAASLMMDIAFVEDQEKRERMAQSMQVLMKSVKVERYSTTGELPTR